MSKKKVELEIGLEGLNKLKEQLKAIWKFIKDTFNQLKDVAVKIGLKGVTKTKEQLKSLKDTFKKLEREKIAVKIGLKGINKTKEQLKSVKHTFKKFKHLVYKVTLIGFNHAKTSIDKIKTSSDSAGSSMDHMGHGGTSAIHKFSRGVIRAMALLYALKQSVQGIAYLFKFGIEAVENYKNATISLAAVLTNLADKSKYSGKTLGQIYNTAYKYSKNLENVLININKKTIVSLQDMNDMTMVMAQSGVALDTSNKKAIQGFINIANAVGSVAAMSQNKTIQIKQETKAIFEGATKQGDTLAKQLNTILNGRLKQMVKEWKKQNTALEHMGDLLKGFSASYGLMKNTFQLVWSSFQTTVSVVMRRSFNDFDNKLLQSIRNVDKWLLDNSEKVQRWINNILNAMISAIKSVAKGIQWLWNNAIKPLVDMIHEIGFSTTGGLIGVLLLGKFAVAGGVKKLLKYVGYFAIMEAFKAYEGATYKSPKMFSDLFKKNGKITQSDIENATERAIKQPDKAYSAISKYLELAKTGKAGYPKDLQGLFENVDKRVAILKTIKKALDEYTHWRNAINRIGRASAVSKFFLGSFASEKINKKLIKDKENLIDDIKRLSLDSYQYQRYLLHKRVIDSMKEHLKLSDIIKYASVKSKQIDKDEAKHKLDNLRKLFQKTKTLIDKRDRLMSQARDSIAKQNLTPFQYFLRQLSILQGKLREIKASKAFIKLLSLAKIKEFYKTFKAKLTDIQQIGKVAAQALQQSFSTFFFDAMQGKLHSLLDYFKSFVTSIEQMFAKMMAKKLMVSVLGKSLGAALGLTSAVAATGSIPAVTVAAKGIAFVNGLRAFANGGLINSPTLFGMANGGVGVAGEAGTEAVMPLGRNSSGELGVKTIGSGKEETTKIQININNQTGQPVKGVQTQTQFDGEQYVVSMVLKNVSENGALYHLIKGGSY